MALLWCTGGGMALRLLPNMRIVIEMAAEGGTPGGMSAQQCTQVARSAIAAAFAARSAVEAL